MAALATLTLVWLGSQKPDTATVTALERFAREHGAKIEEPRRDTAPEAATPIGLAERCEAWLEQARNQMQAGDEQTALGLLAQLEQVLRQHPELLQASWLMAERYRLQARIARRSAPEQALPFERIADVLEGVRAAGFGETSGAAGTAASKVHVTLAVRGARRPESIGTARHRFVIFRPPRVSTTS